MEIINNIISHIEMLKRKYGGSIDSVIEYRDSIIQTEIESGGCNSEINLLMNEVQQLKTKLLECSKAISKYRKSTGIKLEKMIKNSLRHLSMADTNFKIQLIYNKISHITLNQNTNKSIEISHIVLFNNN